MSERADQGTVVVIGAGASGLFTAAALLARSDLERVVVIDRDPAPGGLAYRSPDPHLLLNVYAGSLGADPSGANSFLEWARRRDPEIGFLGFLPRQWFGEYLQDYLAQKVAASSTELVRIDGEVAAVELVDGGASARLIDGRTFSGRAVVLGLGNPDPRPLVGEFAADSPQVLQQPLEGPRLDEIPADDAVTVVGSGMTAVDVVLALSSRGHRGAVRLLSRHGQLPLTHHGMGCAPPEPGRLIDLVTSRPAYPTPVVEALRAEARTAMASGRCWQSVVDSIRPHSNPLWAGFCEDGKVEFVTRYRHTFERHRHRLAPTVSQQFDAEIDSGRVTVEAGSVVGIAERAGGLAVQFEDDRATEPSPWVVNASGPDLRTAAHGPVATGLLEAGVARSGWGGQGLEVDDDGRVVAADGRTSDALWTLGPVCRGTRWETTAIPEIRVQAETIAQRVLGT